MNISKEYKTVNGLLAMLGQAPIDLPSAGTNREKLEYLLDTYAAKLKAAQPQYQHIADNRLIPDLIVMHIVKLLERAK